MSVFALPISIMFGVNGVMKSGSTPPLELANAATGREFKIAATRFRAVVSSWTVSILSPYVIEIDLLTFLIEASAAPFLHWEPDGQKIHLVFAFVEFSIISQS